jgi:formate/nitrite transporter FocA (FNT family)
VPKQPQPVALDSSRRSIHEIFEGVSRNAREELNRSSRALAFSGVAGGVTMGLTGLAVAIVQAVLGSGQPAEFVSYLFYPVGFIAVIIGRAQLFTENTLYPVVLVLDEHKHVGNTLRLWGVVFLSNVVGAMGFGLLAMRSGALEPKVAEILARLGLQIAAQPSAHAFWSGVIGGWLIALVAWMVTASHWTIGQIMVIWLLSFVVGLGHFAHCIASSGEIWSAVFAGLVPVNQYFLWLAFATTGNIVGGIMIVSLLNYGQIKAGHEG